MTNYASAILGFFVTLLCIWLLKPLAVRLNLVDIPGGRKSHARPVPLIGGLAMFLGFTFSLLTVDISLQPYRSLIAACGLITLTGILDDFHELSPKARVLVQIMVGLLISIWGNIQLHQLGNLLFVGNIELHGWRLPFTVFAVVGIINAVNMIDGLDGLAGSVLLIILGLLAVLAYMTMRAADFLIIVILCSCLAGYLLFNFRVPWRKHANIFMGDAGSMFLGLTLVWFLISMSQGKQTSARPVDMLWIMALPLWDVFAVIIYRLMQKRSPFAADRNHFHHLLSDLFESPNKVVFIYCLLTFLFGMVGIAGARFNFSESLSFLGFGLCFIVYVILTKKLWRYVNQLKAHE